MSWRRRAWLALAALLAGCASVPPPDAFITGAVIARERLYIPPDAVFDAALVDVTQVGEPPLVLGEGTRLGWTTWLTSRPLARDADDLKLDAVTYCT